MNNFDVSKWNMSSKTMTWDFSIIDMRISDSFTLIGKIEDNEKFTYVYTVVPFKRVSSEIIKSKYSDKELEFIDQLFNNLDESNLAIINGIIDGKTR